MYTYLYQYFQSQKIIIHLFSRSAVIDGYSFLISSTHYDPDDKMIYRVVNIEYYGDDVVGCRVEIPTKSRSNKNELKSDSVSISEILEYMRMPVANI